VNEEEELLAAELALGLLDGPDADAARLRLAADPAMAARVAWWHEQLVPLADGAAEQPSADLWHRIERVLPVNDNAPVLMRRWRAVAVAAMIGVIALGSTLLLRPPAPSTLILTRSAPAPTLLASLDGKAGVAATVAYSRDNGRLTIVPGTLDTSARDAELWIIPAGGQPVSLGPIDPHSPSSPAVSPDRRALIATGATFAITMEPRGGSPSGKPTGPIVGSGTIAGA
jgi:anti-sigma-K factor RskA